MTLREYLTQRGETPGAFALRAGVWARTVQRILEGSGCHTATALKIIDATRKVPTHDGGSVTLTDLTGVDS